MTEVSAIFMFMYLGLGTMILVVSLFCDCCKYTMAAEANAEAATYEAAQAPVAAATAAAATAAAVGASFMDSLFPQKVRAPARRSEGRSVRVAN